VDFQEEKDGLFHCGCHAIVKITIEDGSYHEDIGYGRSRDETMNSALEKAKKIAVTDGITRTMKQFGSQIGGVYKNTMKKVIEQQNEETNPFPMVHSLKRKKPEESLQPNKKSKTS